MDKLPSKSLTCPESTPRGLSQSPELVSKRQQAILFGRILPNRLQAPRSWRSPSSLAKSPKLIFPNWCPKGNENSLSKYHILSENSRAAPRAFGTPIQKDPLQDLQGQAGPQEESINVILLHDRQGRQGRAIGRKD